MKDNFGDKIEVAADDEDVTLVVNDSMTEGGPYAPGASVSYATLTPAKARKLARKLNKAADEIDGGEAREGYRLDLTEDQAKTLAVILYRIGGTFGSCAPVTARKYAEEVSRMLADLGIDADEIDDDPRFTIDGRDAIYFIGVAE